MNAASMSGYKVAIAGAGIAGLATALSLHAAGHRDITVFERVRELKPLGVGINMLPHAVRELTELGLADELDAIGMPTTALSYFNSFGQPIWSEPRGSAAGYHWPQYAVHRGELQMMLLDAVVARLGADSVRLGHRLEEVTQLPSSTRARFTTASGDSLEVEGDLFVGADGIHSTVRKQYYPDEGGPVWNGLTMWRGVATVPPYLDGHTMIMAGDDGNQKFIAYPLASKSRHEMARVNFIAERRAPEGTEQLVDWNRPVDPAPLVEMFSDWHFDWLDIPQVVAAADMILEYPMVDRDPVERWTFGRTTLLGDAAHAMYPIGSNGASQAIIDARTLAHELSRAESIEAGLEAYEANRRPITAEIVERNRQLGPERVIQIVHSRAPRGFDDVHDVISKEELESFALEYKQAAGFDPALLNARPSLSPQSESRESE